MGHQGQHYARCKGKHPHPQRSKQIRSRFIITNFKNGSLQEEPFFYVLYILFLICTCGTTVSWRISYTTVN